MMHKYEIIISWSDDDHSFVAEVPELPGCAAHGDTPHAALASCGDAIALWIDTAKETGRPVPAPKGRRAETEAMARNEFDEYSRPLVGTQLVSVERLDHSWFLRFGTDIALTTEALWRLINDGRIVVTSEDDGHQFGLPEPVDATARLSSSLRSRIITAALIAPSSGDLAIDFGERTQLQLLQTSCGYESWRLSVRGSETICTGGGEIVRLRTR